jgi:hypothetical protein
MGYAGTAPPQALFITGSPSSCRLPSVDNVDSLQEMIREARGVRDEPNLVVATLMVSGTGEAEGIEAAEEGMCGDSGVLCPLCVS